MDAWYIVTLIGQPEIWAASALIALVLYAFLRRRLEPVKGGRYKKILLIYSLGILLSLSAVFTIKSAFYVQRPCTLCGSLVENCNPYCEPDSSFPSGHAAAIFSMATSLYLGLRRRSVLLLYALAVLVASSRYFLGVHTPADIIVGAAIGISVPFAFSLAYEKRFEKRTKD